ncbi:transposase [Natrinema longum]|uniref:Transposase n=1 Tax=Natrinema longum TaxID=370324 RepID=A0A8A2UDC0_9EURY|nr:transposase [Natrinema longum]MBZ6495563.1 transposase [Natrinema longum]QSW86472.1 transposase [Natrinema longum]
MPPLRNTLADLADERFRTAVLLGLASIPFTVALSWESAPMSFSGEAVVVAGLLAGLHYADRSAEDGNVGLLEAVRYGKRPSVSRRAGVVAGVVGSAPAVGWEVAYTAELVWTLSGWQGAIAVVALPIVVPFLVALFGLGGGVGAAVGDWLVSQADRTRDGASSRAAPDAAADDSRWWWLIAAYVVVAPAVLLYVFGVSPDSDAGLLVAVLSLFVLVPFAVFVAVALFKDAITLLEAGRGWMPNYWVYVGAPLGTYAVAYLAARFVQSTNPSGVGVYAFLIALWLSSIVYLDHRRRYVSVS